MVKNKQFNFSCLVTIYKKISYNNGYNNNNCLYTIKDKKNFSTTSRLNGNENFQNINEQIEDLKDEFTDVNEQSEYYNKLKNKLFILEKLKKDMPKGGDNNDMVEQSKGLKTLKYLYFYNKDLKDAASALEKDALNLANPKDPVAYSMIESTEYRISYFYISSFISFVGENIETFGLNIFILLVIISVPIIFIIGLYNHYKNKHKNSYNKYNIIKSTK